MDRSSKATRTISSTTIIRRFCNETTAHGLAKVADSDDWGCRLVWLLFLLIAFGLMFYQIGLLIGTYFKYPVSVKLKLLHQKKVAFPGITMCNANPFRNSKLSGAAVRRSIVSTSQANY